MIIAVIPAKASSGRLPNKNMHILNGQPMIDYTIDYALASDLIDAVYVSTDSDEIAAHVSRSGAQVIRRDERLGGETPIIDVYRHAFQQIGNLNITCIVGLQPDHPDRSRNADEIIHYFLQQDADQLFSKDNNGIKNGAHYILRSNILNGDTSRKDVIIFDQCTNIHYAKDLQGAEENLRRQERKEVS